MRSRRTALLLAAASLVAAAWACSTFSSTSGGEADSGVDSSTTDALPPPPAEAGDDARVDAGATDADCSWFCDDFEADAWPNGGWAMADEYQRGAIDRTTAEFVSPTHALEAMLPDDGGPTPRAQYARTAYGVKSVHCEVWARLEAQSNDYATLVRLDVQAEAGANHFLFFADNGNKNQIEFYDDNKLKILPALDRGVWHRVGFDYALGTGTRFTIDGVLVNDPLQSPAADAGPESLSIATLRIGADRNAASPEAGTWAVAYDDVACAVTK